MKGKKKHKEIKMIYRRKSARKNSGLNSRQIKRENRYKNKENDIKNSELSKTKYLQMRREIMIIFGVFCAIVSSYFGLSISDTTRYVLINFTAIFVFCLALDLFFYPKD